jgi:hypothetical protein
MSAKEVFESVLTVPTVKKLWTANYQPALPFTPQEFSIGAVMPAILYMFRWGHRRGKGKFSEAYGSYQNEKKELPTIESIVNTLIKRNVFVGFNDASAPQAILGDMLLSSCLENKNHLTGRTEQVQRAYPTHYLASWRDLPDKVAHLRFVPEMLVALLLNQEVGVSIDRSSRRSHFAVDSGFAENILLSLFGNGMEISGQHRTDLTSDIFVENELSVGIDQLLTIRIAQGCKEAPTKARGGESEQIPNQWPLATTAMKSLREDFSVFVQAYGTTIPRQTFLQMLESSISLGLTTIYFSTIRMLIDWEISGSLPTEEAQKPWPLFVDCSTGNDKELRRLSEESMSHFMRSLGRLPVVLMCMRILDEKVRYDRELRGILPSSCPDATAFVNLLGSILHEMHARSEKIHGDLDEVCLRIGDALTVAGIEPDLQERLKKGGNPVVRLSEALCYAMGEGIQYNQYVKVVHSSLMMDEPNGMAQKRKISQKNKAGKSSRADIRSIVLSNSMLDFIVHRHLRKAAKGKGSRLLTFIELNQLLKERYGLYVDEAPPGLSIPVEMLLRNKRILERRLRDLGVLVGVNDAESMKRLRQRFRAVGDD